MHAAKLRIEVVGYKALAAGIGHGPLEETISRLPQEAGFVRGLFSLPQKEMNLCLLAIPDSYDSLGRVSAALTYEPMMRWDSLTGAPRISIDIGLGGEFGELTRFSRSSIMIHELTHAHILNFTRIRCVPLEIHEGMAVYAEMRYQSLMQTDAWLNGMMSPEIAQNADPGRYLGKEYPVSSGGFRFFEKIARRLGPAKAFRSMVIAPPRHYELTRPSNYLRRMGDRSCAFPEDAELPRSGHFAPFM
jgi:hypothetical protein